MDASRDGFPPPSRTEFSPAGTDALDGPVCQGSDDALRVLAEFNAELAACLDHREALQRVATLTVPRLADLCALDLIDEQGRFERVGVAHNDPEQAAFLSAMADCYPPWPDAEHGPAHVAHSGKPEFIPEVDEDALHRIAQDARHLALLRELQIRSFIGVPLIARERTLGVMSMAMAGSGRVYGDFELRLARDMATHAALIVDNAQLYQAKQRELAQRRRAEALARESQARMQFALNAAQVGTWDWDVRSDALTWCENMASIHAVHAGEAVGTIEDFQALIHPEDRTRVMEQLHDALATGAEYRAEYRLASDGDERWVSTRGQAALDENGQPRRMGGICMDITERVDALRERTRLAAIVDSSQDAIVSQDLDGRITSWNAGAERIYGYSAGEAIGRPMSLLVADESRDEVAALHERLCRGEKVELVETLHRHKDGRPIPVSLSCAPVFGRGETVVATSVIARDISEVKRLNRDLQRRLDELQILLDVAPVGIAVAHDPDGMLITVNPTGAALRGTGIAVPGREPRFRAMSHGRPLSPEQLPMRFAMANRTVVTGMELEIVHPDGRVHTLYEYASPLYDEGGQVRGGLEVFVDITRIKQVEAALRESRERMLAALLASGTGTFRWDMASGNLDLDDNLREAFGLGSGDTVDVIDDLLERVHPSERDEVSARLHRTAQTGEDLDLQLRICWPDGSDHWIACKAKTVFDEHTATPLYITGAGVDITERKRSEEALRSSEERFRMALMGSPVVVFAHDRELRYTWVHNATVRPFTQVLGKRDDQLLENETHGHRLLKFKQRVLNSGKGDRREMALKFRSRLYFYDITVEPRRDDAGRIIGLIGAAVDITERRRLEAQLRRQARLLRQADHRKDEFLAMLAHELRNPLAPIRNAVQLLQSRPDKPDPTLAWAGEVIERQVDQMSRLVDDLLDVARITQGRITLLRRPTDLADVFARAVETVTPILKEYGHELIVTPPDSPLWLDADQPRLAQVFANLLHNAIKYTEPGGKIRLVARRHGDVAEVRVADTGVGIPLDLLPRIFDLFSQSDRSLDRSQGGLGLGLTLVRSLVEMHGGTVTAHSPGEDRGCEFVVRLPCLPECSGPATSAPELPPPAEVSARRVLVVDDNHDSAVSFAYLLSSLGHEVNTVYSGADALVAVKRHEPQVVFLDIGLPGLDGYETARRLRARYGDRLNLVALTGYGDEETRRRCREVGFDHFLLKPGDIDTIIDLLAAVRA